MICLFFIQTYDFVRACLPRVGYDSVVSHTYYSLRRPHYTKSLLIICFYKILRFCKVHACLGVWLEPVVSHTYYSLRRPHFTKSLLIIYFIKFYDFVRACLPRVGFEPVVSHAYYSLRRPHYTKSLHISIFLNLTILYVHA